MSDLSIKLSIAGRTYPLTIKREEEEVIRKAAKQIDEHVRKLQQTYAVKDKQDLLAMTALQMTTHALKQAGSKEDNKHAERLENLESVLKDYLS